MTPVEKYREFLANKGLRLTREREIVAEEIFSGVAPFDAEQLLVRLASREHRISRATMYRTLDGLLDAGLIRMVKESNGREVYYIA